MPDMSNFPGGGEMPDMSNFPGGSEYSGMNNRPGRGNGFGQSTGRGDASSDGKMQFGNTGETVTKYIPVGVVVHTVADVRTTFSRLVSGDLIKLLVESNNAAEDIIEEIWMLQ